MEKSLIIVESPSKAKTIGKYLGKNFIVEASVGHIIDLPKSKLGIDIEKDFLPHYAVIKGKSEVVKKLKSNAKESEKIFIATDPDREGEAIAFHIANEIKKENKNIFRVLFNEITQKAITVAIQNPTHIDDKLVNAQQARRAMDRILGFKVSPFLWKKVRYGLSAGRVQSVALRLICEREEEINSFKSTEYWSIVGEFQTEKKEIFFSKLFKISDKEIIIPEKEVLDELKRKGILEKYISIDSQNVSENIIDDIKNQSFQISKIQKRESKVNPKPPFITSSLQQAAFAKLRFSPKKTMMIAQKLYEGVELGSEGTIGLISYMRTDSTRLNDEIVDNARNYILEVYGKEFLPQEKTTYTKKKNSQDAHEAIRPTSLKYNPQFVKNFLSKDEFVLYELIWNRFIACQMSNAILETRTILIEGGKYIFKSVDSSYVFLGFLKIYKEEEEEKNLDEDDEIKRKIPLSLKENQIVDLENLIPHQHFSKPPARFSESTLVKELESLGIGRPSTYASIVSTVIEREYVIQKERRLFPTLLGIDINKILVYNFPDIFNVKFTAKMEHELDTIAIGKSTYIKVMNDFYKPFSKSLESAESKTFALPHELQTDANGQVCEKCGSKMIEKWGRGGKFLACSSYPNCKNTKSIGKDEREEPKFSGEKCEKCGSEMLIKKSRYGEFFGCSKYPTCKNIKPIPSGIRCPKFKNGDVIKRSSKRGKAFFGCSKYPECDFVSWNEVVNQTCDNCQNEYLLKKYTEKKGNHLYCDKCKSETLIEDKQKLENG